MLGFGSEKEMLQELGSSQFLAITQFYDFGNILHHINDLHLFIKLQAILRVITEAHRLTNINCSAVCLYFSHQDFDKSRFTGTIISHNTHLFITGKDIREIFQYLQITE